MEAVVVVANGHVRERKRGHEIDFIFWILFLILKI